MHSYHSINGRVPEQDLAVAQNQPQADQSGLNQVHVVVKHRSGSLFPI